MQNEQMTVRGYSPQNTGRMNTVPYQVEEPNRWKQLWQLLDPAAVALLVAAILGLGYALYATITYWWLTKIIAHLVIAWVSVGINAMALFRSNRQLMAVAAVGYVIAMLLFMNYFYLLLLQALLCIWAWWKSK